MAHAAAVLLPAVHTRWSLRRLHSRPLPLAVLHSVDAYLAALLADMSAAADDVQAAAAQVPGGFNVLRHSWEACCKLLDILATRLGGTYAWWSAGGCIAFIACKHAYELARARARSGSSVAHSGVLLACFPCSSEQQHVTGVLMEPEAWTRAAEQHTRAVRPEQWPSHVSSPTDAPATDIFDAVPTSQLKMVHRRAILPRQVTRVRACACTPVSAPTWVRAMCTRSPRVNTVCLGGALQVQLRQL